MGSSGQLALGQLRRHVMQIGLGPLAIPSSIIFRDDDACDVLYVLSNGFFSRKDKHIAVKRWNSSLIS